MRLAALDVGDRRVGVAISDGGGHLATPLAVLERGSKAEDFARIAALLQQSGVSTLVVGLPLNEDDSAGPQARRIERYARALGETMRASGLQIPIVLWDEHLSTQRAQSLLLESGRGARRRRQRIDSAAAAVILQDYLDSDERDRSSGILDVRSPAA